MQLNLCHSDLGLPSSFRGHQGQNGVWALQDSAHWFVSFNPNFLIKDALSVYQGVHGNKGMGCTRLS
jgi:hypothetical protein